MMQSQTNRNDNESSFIDFHGATVINTAGEEIPITEQMVQQACRQLIQLWEQFYQHNSIGRTK